MSHAEIIYCDDNGMWHLLMGETTDVDKYSRCLERANKSLNLAKATKNTIGTTPVTPTLMSMTPTDSVCPVI